MTLARDREQLLAELRQLEVDIKTIEALLEHSHLQLRLACQKRLLAVLIKAISSGEPEGSYDQDLLELVDLVTESVRDLARQISGDMR